MNPKTFLKEIRSIIREEIEYALDKRAADRRKKSPNETIAHGVSLYKEAVSAAKSNPKKPAKQKNMSAIQSLLEQTRQSLQENYNEDGDFTFTSNSLNAFANNHVDATPVGVDPNTLTPEVSKALTRDYSQLMAKINEKKGAS